MKKHNQSGQFRRGCSLSGWARLSWLLLAVAGLPPLPCDAAQLKEARVSQVIKDVKLVPAQAAPRPAAVSDEVRNGTAVRTGNESRAELTFTDQTLARLGANTIFSFDRGTRNLELGGGAMLLRVPKNAGGAQIDTAAVTAAITGTTVMLEYHPDAFIKFIILEGTGRIFRKDHLGESVLVHAGQMLIVNPNGKGLPDPVDVDLERLMKTSLLINGFPPLPSDDLIARAINSQDTKKNEGDLIQTNLVIFGGGTTVSLLDPTYSNTIDQANDNTGRRPTSTATPTPTATATPTPSKEGTPTAIASPVPYVISSATTIETDPTITTNGVTDFGKIYRGPALDGPASVWLFTATSAFDTKIGLDAFFGATSPYVPLATLKFLALKLTGNPTISIANGGPTNLALISVGDITSGPPGGNLTFSGLDGLFLGTQDGSITLTSDLAFQDIATLGIYARGAGSILTFDSTVSGTTYLALASEGSILFNNAFSLTETNVSGSQLYSSFQSGGDLTASDGFTVNLDNSGSGVLNGDAVLTLISGGSLTANGETGLSLTIANTESGQITGQALLGISTDGNLTATAVNLLVDNSFGGSIGSNAGITLIGGQGTISGDLAAIIGNNAGGSILGSSALFIAFSGDLSTSGEADFTLDNSAFDGDGFSVGGDIAQDAAIGLMAQSVSTGSGLYTFLYNDGGGHIGGDASVAGAVLGNLTTQGDLFFDLQNSADTGQDDILPGGTIEGNATVEVAVSGNIVSHGIGEFAVLNNDFRFLSQAGTILGDATLILSAANITTTGFFQPLINNTNGSIGGDATVSLLVSGDISSGAETFFNILNSNGSIGGSAISNLIAANYSTGSTFNFQILNDAGTIGGDAFLTAALSGGLISTGDAVIQITNNGGQIGGNSLLTFSAGGDLTGGSLLAFINNRDGGSIGGEAGVLLSVGGALTTTGDATIVISGRDDGGGAGSIGGNASVALTADSVNVGGALVASVSEAAGGHLASGLTSVNVAGDIMTGGALTFSIQNGGLSQIGQVGGGTIDQDVLAFLNAANVTTGDFFTGLIANLDGGQIGGSAALALNLTGDLNAQGDAIFQIDNSTTMGTLSSTIGSEAAIGVAASNFTAGSLFAQITNEGGGSVAGGATIDFAIAQNLTSVGDATFEILNDDNDAGFGGGTIGSDAAITVAAGTLAAASLTAQIDNLGGTIGENATINMNVSGNATVTNDATVTIDESSGAGSAAININGGNYTVGGTFLSTISDDGALTFNSAIVNADVIKAGVFGSNGTLTVGGGTLSGNTTLKLYAPGSNGQLNFVSNVTLNSESSVILAANAVTINNGIVVTITGDDGADALVFTNVPNYTGSGGNSSTTGTFAGNGAQTLPLDQAPPFDDLEAPAQGHTTSVETTAPTPTTIPALPENRGSGAKTISPRSRPRLTIARVADSNELLDLADRMISSPIETGHDKSKAQAGRTSRGPGSAWSRKERPSSSATDLALARGGARRPALPP